LTPLAMMARIIRSLDKNQPCGKAAAKLLQSCGPCGRSTAEMAPCDHVADPALVFKLAQDQVCIPLDAMVRLGISSEGLPVRAVEGESCFVLGPANGIAARTDAARQGLGVTPGALLDKAEG
jgi:hypothetical protein